MSSIYDYSATRANGTEASLSEYKGQVLLVVNTASKCGFTPQYEGLEKLYRDHKDAGFLVLAFPCNQFGSQEPGSNEEIKAFANERYRVNFPMFDKVEVNGGGACPLYQWLKGSTDDNGDIKWNFAKFLVNPDGDVVAYYGPQRSPDSMVSDIDTLLSKA